MFIKRKKLGYLHNLPYLKELTIDNLIIFQFAIKY